jgi:predicted nucleic acid-binding protein
MSIEDFKANYLDAVAAVKLVLKERGSDHLENYFNVRTGFFITSLCFAEALGVLKRKKLKRKLSEKQYLDSCYLLLTYVRQNRIRIDDGIQISSLDVFAKTEEIIRRHKLDFSDSLQLVSVKHGRFSKLARSSKTLLITADRDLASAAKTEGLRVWNCEVEAAPPDNGPDTCQTRR